MFKLKTSPFPCKVPVRLHPSSSQYLRPFQKSEEPSLNERNVPHHAPCQAVVPMISCLSVDDLRVYNLPTYLHVLLDCRGVRRRSLMFRQSISQSISQPTSKTCLNDEIDPFSHLLSFSHAPPPHSPSPPLSPMQSINQSILTAIRTHLLHILTNAAAQHTATRHLYATWQPSSPRPPHLEKIIVEISSHPSSFLRQVPHDTIVCLPRAPPSRAHCSIGKYRNFLFARFVSFRFPGLASRPRTGLSAI